MTDNGDVRFQEYAFDKRLGSLHQAGIAIGPEKDRVPDQMKISVRLRNRLAPIFDTLALITITGEDPENAFRKHWPHC